MSVPSRSGFDLFLSHLYVSSVADALFASHRSGRAVPVRPGGGGRGGLLCSMVPRGLSFLLISPQLTVQCSPAQLYLYTSMRHKANSQLVARHICELYDEICLLRMGHVMGTSLVIRICCKYSSMNCRKHLEVNVCTALI